MHSETPLRSQPWPEPPRKQTRVFHVAGRLSRDINGTQNIEHHHRLGFLGSSITCPPIKNWRFSRDEHLVDFSQQPSACHQTSHQMLFHPTESWRTKCEHWPHSEMQQKPQAKRIQRCPHHKEVSKDSAKQPGLLRCMLRNILETGSIRPGAQWRDCTSSHVSGKHGPSNYRAHLLGSAVGFAMCDVHITICEFK